MQAWSLQFAFEQELSACNNGDMNHSSPGVAGNDRHAEPAFSRAQLVFLAVIGLSLALSIAFAWTTRDALRRPLAGSGGGGSRRAAAPKTIVDISPWQTAEALSQMAATVEEKAFAQQAERLADHSVDQAFAATLREANLRAQDRKLTGDAQAIANRISQLQQVVAQDQAAVKQLSATQSANKPAQGSEDSDDADLQIAKAQLQLDSDELSDAQDDLDRATGDERSQIQSELSAHEAEMKKWDSQSEARGEIAVVAAKQYGTLSRRLGAWFRQRTRMQMLADAEQQARSDVRAFSAAHDALSAKLGAAGAASGDAGTDQTSRLARLRNGSIERQLLSIYDDRIQTEQQLADVYKRWTAQVQVQHRIVLHLVLTSLTWVLAILATMVLAIALLRRLMQHPVLDVRQRHTLRSILELCIQIVGVGCILLVIFGPPQQTATVLGLATAALTVALQDFILAFLGWFILIGKKGIRVGDTVEIDGVGGEVLEIGLMSTTLLETGTLAERGYPTGRRISLMNSFAIKHKYFNFSTAGQWLWDRVDVVIPSSEGTHLLAEQILQAAREETSERVTLAEREWSRARSAGLSNMSAAPSVNLRPAGENFGVELRYITRASERFQMRNRLYRRVIDLLQTTRNDHQVGPNTPAILQPNHGED
jgi:small-conductance mechanosensitive channel